MEMCTIIADTFARGYDAEPEKLCVKGLRYGELMEN